MADDFKTVRGNGGETHQQASKTSEAVLTTNQGIAVADNQNSLKSGARGPTLLEDFVLREKIFHFDHERIPERIVHARGSGAHGVFKATDDISDICKSAVFRKGTETELFARFSTVAGGAGSVDTPRDVRGFSVKMYTTEGNWDFVGNNIPVFFIQDAIKFPDLIHAVKMEADRGYPQAGSAHMTFWDFASLMPETTHMLMWAMSDRTLPRSLRTIEGFGVHTFRLINEAGEASLVKFHWKPRAGLQSTIWDEALKLQAAENDYHRRDLFEAIDRGDYPEWDLGIQVFDEEFARAQPYDVLDSTKIVPEEDVPVRIIGTMTLNRNPDNFFAEVEQVAFCPANVPPGIDFSNDPLLQGRLFSYLDTQKSRLGTTNFHQIPVNAARCPVMNFNRDGQMQMAVPKGRANYEPNTLAAAGEDGGPRECPVRGHAPSHLQSGDDEVGEKLRARGELFGDHYSQARLFWISQDAHEQAHIASSFVFELSKTESDSIPPRMVANLRNVDEGLAKRVADGLGIALPDKAKAVREPVEMKPSDALSIHKNMKTTLKGRLVGVLIADGTDADALTRLLAAIEKEGAAVKIVSPKVGGAKLSNGKHQKADGQLAGTPSQLFDAVAVVTDKAGTATLLKDSAAVEWVMNAFGHLKAIGASEAAKPLLDKANVVPDDGVTGLGADFIKAAKTRFYDREPSLRTLA